VSTLLKKELRLALHPMNLCFLSLSALLLVPNYPYYVTFFYTTLGIFMMFQTARENRDIFYMMLLPVRKRDMVRARFLMVMLIELAQMVCCIPFMYLRGTYASLNNAVGIEANLAFLGISFLMLGVFHLIFFPGFYKTAQKVGIPFLLGSTAFFLMIIAAEILLRVLPYLRSCCDSMAWSDQIMQIPLLLGGLLGYLVLTFFAYRISVRRFEALDIA